ncbi:hypothetical protein QAD02_019982 [Eretmocerus hayati]|uniref:Uncharacterized protein n=1 Tax=Eretmocerus hayati TaxID=131215 RepID=A0ACC2PKR4_9HYME|nr:hypothetical protein QAD02_019982 [Eretmocerus hayati]
MTSAHGCGYDEDDDDDCGCDEGASGKGAEKRIVSEIANTGLPYKEIEVTFNGNKMVMRMQKEPITPKYDPPCDCIEPVNTASKTNNAPRGNNVVFQKASEGCRTISVYPNPDSKKPEKSDKSLDAKRSAGGKEHTSLPTVNPEDNPNIFVLRIKRKCENGDKKHNIDLEFRAPRPWQNRSKK